MATAASSRDGLTIDGIGNVACCEDAWDIGGGVGMIDLDVALCIDFHTGMLCAIGIGAG